MDDHQVGNITKLKKKLHCPHTTHLSSWPPYPLKENFNGVLIDLHKASCSKFSAMPTSLIFLLHKGTLKTIENIQMQNGKYHKVLANIPISEPISYQRNHCCGSKVEVHLGLLSSPFPMQEDCEIASRFNVNMDEGKSAAPQRGP
jgi:hypothetical protein